MTNELYHYGVLGMKWGVRRYQNADGSLTKLGKLRYGTPENLRKSYAKKTSKKEHNNAYKDVKKMSNEELQKNIERLKLEKQLKELTNEDVKKGESAVKKILLKSAESAATSITTTALTNAGKYAIKELTGLDITDNNLGKIKEKTEIEKMKDAISDFNTRREYNNLGKTKEKTELEKLQDEYKLASTKEQLRKLREAEENRKKQENN